MFVICLVVLLVSDHGQSTDMRLVTTRSGLRVAFSTTIRADLYEKLMWYAKEKHGGTISRALDELLEIAFRVLGALPTTSLTVKVEVGPKRSSDERRKNEKEEPSPVEAEVATKIAIGKLREHLGLLQSFRENLQRYIKLRKNAPTLLANLGISPPNADSISKHVDRIMKDVEKVMKDRKVVKTQELLELVDSIQKEAEEVRALLAEFMKL